MDIAEARSALNAAQKLFAESSTTLEKARSVITLLKGKHPRLDAPIAELERHLAALEKVQTGAYIELSAEALPEETEEQKKRKRALLLFIKTWNDLKSEVARIEREFDSAKQGEQSQASMWGNIFGAVKGPLAIVTLVATLLAVMHTTSVSIVIHNDGCGIMHASTRIPVSLPGLSFPSDPIESGGSATVVIPPLPVSVDGTEPGLIVMNAFGLDLTFQTPGVRDVQFNGVSLLGKKTDIKLSEKPVHELRLSCQ